MRVIVFLFVSLCGWTAYRYILKTTASEKKIQVIIKESNENANEKNNQNLLSEVEVVVDHVNLTANNQTKNADAVVVRDDNQIIAGLIENPMDEIQKIETDIEQVPYLQRASRRDHLYQLLDDNVQNKEISEKFFIKQFEQISKNIEEVDLVYQYSRLIYQVKQSSDDVHVLNTLAYLKSVTEHEQIKLQIENEIEKIQSKDDSH